ncbi:MAG: bifunctional salicylyl-CoA 5-hydroxylase/oxidoreductase [Proteobacteria bacterium]|nr:MAG: bifunctional salicylyl-CoA 5-hydroxylase/oxidoreductase [Pseudomonadota bacterium]
MNIVCIGGGPAGLYFSILMKQADPAHRITVLERNRPDDTFGWGVVFSDATLGNFAAADPETHAQILRSFHHWDDIDIFFKGEKITSGGHGFCGIARKKLLNILQGRAQALGVHIQYETEITDDAAFADADLIVAADGVNSAIRREYAEQFQPDIDVRKCRYIWLGSHKRLDAFTFAFEETPWGWFQLHAYRFDADTSTFIVETREENWLSAGLDRADQAASIAFCERLFGKYLDGNRLMSNARHLRGSAWLNFQRVLCRRWHHRNVVLIGDAAHTAHFSIGSGTKLAMEDAISLTQTLSQQKDVERALELYQEERSIEALRLQSAARNRMEWFENVARYTHLDPVQFSYALLTGSQRIGHENLRLRDSRYVASVESWVATRSGLPSKPVPPMFTPFHLRELRLKNRVVVSPMAMYSCQDGVPDDFYLVHLGSRALGGPGLVFTEMTCVAADARISPGCAGLWNREQAVAWQRIVDFVHQRSSAAIGLQLGHAGPKGSTQLGWEEIDEPLPAGGPVANWPLIAPSPIAYGPHNQTPRAMTRADMDRVRDEFVRAAKLGVECGFDILELHCAHGYLLSSFICPLTNLRTDAYGGSLENRLRFPIEVFKELRAVWPESKPMSVRISAHDWAPGGNTPDDAIAIARRFKDAGADLIDVSSGQTTRLAKPVYGRMYQTPFSDRIRNEVGIATMAVGNIFEADHVNSIIAAGRADLCALARPHLADPFWTLHAAAELGYTDVEWPNQYLTGKAQLERNVARAAQMAINV